mmetsp:Transcript_7822/g.24153  ORF Transcript_7822/g.24153 Transcript_7822/m.24153 type:complete len:248 (+) Transcript_7822:4753-5496(+)
MPRAHGDGARVHGHAQPVRVSARAGRRRALAALVAAPRAVAQHRRRHVLPARHQPDPSRPQEPQRAAQALQERRGGGQDRRLWPQSQNHAQQLGEGQCGRQSGVDRPRGARPEELRPHRRRLLLRHHALGAVDPPAGLRQLQVHERHREGGAGWRAPRPARREQCTTWLLQAGAGLLGTRPRRPAHLRGDPACALAHAHQYHARSAGRQRGYAHRSREHRLFILHQNPFGHCCHRHVGYCAHDTQHL